MGFSIAWPHFNHEVDNADFVPTKPAFSMHQLTKAEHHAVSSLEVQVGPMLVTVLRYSITRGAFSLPGISMTPFSFSAMGSKGKFSGVASLSTSFSRKFFEDQPSTPLVLCLIQKPSVEIASFSMIWPFVKCPKILAVLT